MQFVFDIFGKKIIFAQIEYFFILFPLMMFLLILLRKKYINENQRLYKKIGEKRAIFFLRLFFFGMLLLALCNPYVEKKEFNDTITRMMVFIDNSHSMKLFDLSGINKTLDEINKEISLDVKNLDMGDYTALGNAILNNLQPNENILLISDGQNNFGSSLEDVFLFSGSINSKIYTIKIEPEKKDALVYIEGPDKVVSEVENSFFVRIKEINMQKTPNLKVYIDDNLVYEGSLKDYEIKKSFRKGDHIIKAIIESDDLFPENNEFYKVVRVYDKAKVLLISDKTELEKLYGPFYELDVKKSLPNVLDSYYAIILNNINAKKLSSADIDKLERFVSDGNGLLVIGGKDSYDWGDYNASLIMNLLPVSLGKANKKKDITNVVILMDTGVSATDEISPGVSQFDVQKSLAADLVKSMSNTNKVGIIEANYFLNTISGLSELGPKKNDLINEIALLKPQGISELRFAFQNAYDMLKLTKGSKNILIITDGLFRDEKLKEKNMYAYDQQATIKLAEKAAQDNIKTFVIGVGEKADEDYLKKLKDVGNGEYFKINEKARIKLHFGDPTENTEELKIFVYDSNHFITKEIKELGNIYGFNSVYPKSNSRLLLTTSKGDPVLTIWNYGLGRVASLTTDETWAPDLLGVESSKLLIKTLNWLIEDPERKNQLIIDFPDFRVGEDSVITIRANKMPPDLNFYETSKGIFKSSFYPNEAGIITILSSPVAVNYKKEYLNLGFNEEIERAVKISGGDIIYNDAKTIITKIKSEANIETIKRENLSYLFIFGAIIIYLIELFVRRLFEIKYKLKDI